MRSVLLLLLVCSLAASDDAVHLKNGRLLRGAVVEETDDHVILEMGAGRMTVPRSEIRLVERGATRSAPRRVETLRDEWFLVLHHSKVVGWRRVVVIAQPHRTQVEERTIFFRPDGGTDVDIRRVESVDPDGRPLEFLLMESYGKTMEVTSGQVVLGKVEVRIHRNGETIYRELDLPKDWTLALPAWSRFLDEANPGAARTITALDLRRLRPVQILLRRAPEDAPAEVDGHTRRCRAVTLTSDVRTARSLYRPDRGSLEVELNGATLIAKRTTRERVELAKRAHAGRKPITVEEANAFPFYRRPKDLTAYQPRAGFSVEAPDAGWIPHPSEADTGLVLSFEKIALFSSVEFFAYPMADPLVDVDKCLERALARLRLTAGDIHLPDVPKQHTVRGLPARIVRVQARHRGENLRCLVSVIRAKSRYLVMVGAVPERWWRWAEKDFRAFARSIVMVD